MTKINEDRPKRFRRTKQVIENSIHEAAKELILQKGFSKMTVFDIIKRAKIEPITFYYRYKNQEEFYDYFVREYDYWFQDTLKNFEDGLHTEEEYTTILQTFVNELKHDSVMLELLRWEINDANKITQRTAMMREETTLPLIKKYEQVFEGTNIDIAALSSLLVAGIYYLMLHKRCASFCGIDLNTKEGVQRILEILSLITHLVFQEKNKPTPKDCPKKQTDLIIERMRQKGMSEEDIAYCLDNIQ